MAGVVFLRKFSFPCFELDTAIEPSNSFAVPHADLVRYDRQGKLDVMYVLTNIHADMERAIQKCRKIEPKRKEKLLAFINGQGI